MLAGDVLEGWLQRRPPPEILDIRLLDEGLISLSLSFKDI
jgi:hypothetical protein